jgi:hypothetical protein
VTRQRAQVSIGKASRANRRWNPRANWGVWTLLVILLLVALAVVIVLALTVGRSPHA